MSLATRCSTCGTAFRIVQDQLKVSEGWVRCGRCSSVFNALEGLFDLGRDAPPDWTESGGRADDGAVAASAPAVPARADEEPGEEEFEKTLRYPPAATSDWAMAPAKPGSRRAPRSPQPAQAPAAPSAALEGSDDDGESSGNEEPATDLGELLADPIDARLFGPRKRTEHPKPKPAVELGGRDRVEFSDARFDSDLFPDNPPPEAEAELDVLPSTDAGALPLESASHPEFVRRADRRARWQSRRVRAVLAVAALVAAGVLALQVVHHDRDAIAARWPSLRDPLVSWCRVAGCRIEAPRHIEDVVVESTALTRAAAADTFVLSVTLRSRSPVPVTTPSIDLALTDATGRLVARRVLAPRDIDAAEVLQPNTEAGLQVQLTAGPVGVVGYTVEIFYP
jgi:predicted Zn finger-like uncharacterized protein